MQFQNATKEDDLQILIQTKESNPRVLSLSQENYSPLFDNKGNLKSNTSFTKLKLSGKNLNVKGELTNTESTSEKNSELQYLLFEFNEEQSQNLSLSEANDSTRKEITTF
ncbi:MAG: hypothetical protein GDA46_06840 [Bdellovibrionales bacterium]|nr:hypothetical protein [Bdellovibrionales bacterium]